MNGFFKEDNGNLSSSRLIFAIGSIWTMGLCTYLVVAGNIEPGGLVATFSALEGVFVGLKLGQKPLEKKNNA